MPMIPPGQRAARRATSMAARQNGIAQKAKRSKAQFDTFDPKTANAALTDFKATHAWARDGDQDEVKKAVAYLLSKEGGRYGSQRYAQPGDAQTLQPGTPPPPAGAPARNPAADAVMASAPGPRLTPSGKPAMAPMNRTALANYRERYGISRRDWSEDGSLERLLVKDGTYKPRATRRRRGIPDGTYEMR